MWVAIPEERGLFGNLGVWAKIVLKWTLKV
jgi:hypothetical protein